MGVSSLLSRILLFVFSSPSGGSRVEAGPAEILQWDQTRIVCICRENTSPLA
jgi:hypothetical protein